MSPQVELDAWDWLEPGGAIPRAPAERRRRALFVARCIEYGGPLGVGEYLATLIPCPRRPGGASCRGFLDVGKEADGRLRARCPECGGVALRVRGWESTPWACGPVPQRQGDDAPSLAERETELTAGRPPGDTQGAGAGGEGDAQPAATTDGVDRRLEAVLAQMNSSLDAATVRRHIALARTPSTVVEIVAGTGVVHDEAALESLCDALIDAWNHTPRAELGGRTPAQMSRAMTMPADAARMGAPAAMASAVATEAACLCGSGAPAAQCCAPQFH